MIVTCVCDMTRTYSHNDEQLVEKDCSIISDDESGFYRSSKKSYNESPPVNENDDINTLTDV